MSQPHGFQDLLTWKRGKKKKNQFDYEAMDRDPRANLVYH